MESKLLDELDQLPVHTMPAGTELRHETQSYVRYTPIVLKGSIKVSRIDWNGKELLMYFIGQRQTCFLTVSASLNNNFSTVDSLRAVCEEETAMVNVADHLVREWHEKYPSWRAYINQTYNSRFADFFSIIDNVVFKSADQKLIEKLNELSDIQGIVRITHQELANRIGSAREVVSRLLKTLEKDKKVKLGRGMIRLLNEQQ